MKLLFFLFSCCFCWAQQSIRVTYECRSKFSYYGSPEKEIANKALYQLTNNGLLSEFKSIETIDKQQIMQMGKTATDTMIIHVLHVNKGVDIKDYDLEMNFVKAELDGKLYFYSDKFKNATLNFKTELKKIDKYTCKLVEGVNPIDNSPIKFWYTDEIPLADGPITYWMDLPGLILHVEYPLMEFYAVKIEFFDKILPISKFPDNTSFITRNEYNELLRKSLSLDSNTLIHDQKKVDSYFNKQK